MTVLDSQNLRCPQPAKAKLKAVTLHVIAWHFLKIVAYKVHIYCLPMLVHVTVFLAW